MTGLEFWKAIFDGTLRLLRSPVTLDFTGAEVEEGRIVSSVRRRVRVQPDRRCAWRVRDDHSDPQWAARAYDTGRWRANTSLETSVNFVRPITSETGPVRCEGKILATAGRRIATAEAA